MTWTKKGTQWVGVLHDSVFHIRKVDKKDKLRFSLGRFALSGKRRIRSKSNVYFDDLDKAKNEAERLAIKWQDDDQQDGKHKKSQTNIKNISSRMTQPQTNDVPMDSGVSLGSLGLTAQKIKPNTMRCPECHGSGFVYRCGHGGNPGYHDTCWRCRGERSIVLKSVEI
jgi:hypothetical protein